MATRIAIVTAGGGSPNSPTFVPNSATTELLSAGKTIEIGQMDINGLSTVYMKTGATIDVEPWLNVYSGDVFYLLTAAGVNCILRVHDGNSNHLRVMTQGTGIAQAALLSITQAAGDSFAKVDVPIFFKKANISTTAAGALINNQPFAVQNEPFPINGPDPIALVGEWTITYEV